VRHLGAGLLPQSPCFSSPNLPTHFERDIAKPSALPDACIAAAETEISATLGWGGGRGGGETPLGEGGVPETGDKRREEKGSETPTKLGSAGVRLQPPSALIAAVSPNDVPVPAVSPNDVPVPASAQAGAAAVAAPVEAGREQ